MFLPIVIRTSRLRAPQNAKNWPGLVLMRKSLEEHRWSPILAQEVYESRWKLNPVNVLRYILQKSARRKLNAMGAEITLQAHLLDGSVLNEGAHRWVTADSLVRFYREFKDMTANDAYKLMEQSKPRAVSWLLRNYHKIEEK